MAINIDRFYRIWNLLQSTPYPVLKDIMAQNAPLYSDTAELYRNVLTNTTVSNGNIYDSQGGVLYTGYTGKAWGIDPTVNFSYPKDLTIINAAFQAREKSWNFFSNIMIPGSFAYNTADMDLYRKMLIDWNGAFRTMKDLLSSVSDAFTLDDEDVDKAIKGFGIDFINQDSLQNVSLRQAYLLNLCDLYKIKGSPESIIRALELANVTNPIIREYWIERDPKLYKTLRIRGKALGIYDQHLDTDSTSASYNQYVFNNDPTDFPDILLSMSNFQQRLHDIADSHWWYTTNQITKIEWDPETIIKLPSITPFFGIEFSTLINRYDTVISILENIMSGQINTILSGNKNLVPQEIGISGYNADLTHKDLWITGYAKPLSLVECYLGFVYCQIRYDEWLEYSDLRNFMVAHGVHIQEQSYPWSLQKLIYWAWENKDVYVTPAYTIDSVLRMYKRQKTHYYLSTNELINWWLSLSPSNMWVSSTNNNMDPNLFNIFFSTQYTFQYNADKTDTNLDKILFYTGTRRLDYKNPPFEYFQTLNDSDRALNTTGRRIPFDNEFKSDLPSNYTNNYQGTLFENQDNYQKTFYDYTSWIPNDYHDRITHDGSSVQPYYVSKYPKGTKWNWAIDSNYFYLSIGSGQWIRNQEVETSWPSGEGPAQSFLDANKLLGFQCYHNDYCYCYVSVNTWVRYPVITNWDYCESPISPDGYLKLTSDIARESIVGIIDPTIASIYLTNPNSLFSTFFNITLSPFTDTPQIVKYDKLKLDTLISTYALTVDVYGNVKQDFSFYFHTNSYLYQRLIDSDTNEVLWVKSPFVTSWNTNGSSMYDGGYRFPNLDLTNRYDADRILSGINVILPSDLPTDSVNNGKILVCQGPNGYPQTYYFDTGTNTWKQTLDNEINTINLGVNQGLKDWIDTSVSGDESKYDTYANTLLNSFASYIQNAFRDTTFNIAGVYRDISYSGLYYDIIEFFKPKRARPLYFSTNLEFDDRLRNSIVADERIDTTKILQEINDYNPRNDGIYISDDTSMYTEVYHSNDVTKSLIIPVNSSYGIAKYYLTGFEDNRCNGFYFHRPDLSTSKQTYYLNYHNVALVYITNEQPILGYSNEWILALRKNAIDWCDALYVNYNSDPTTPVAITWTTETVCLYTNGTTAQYSLQNTPINLLVFINGILQEPNVSYTINKNIITFSNIVETGRNITAYYSVNGYTSAWITTSDIPPVYNTYRLVFDTSTLTIDNVNDSDLNKNINLSNYQKGKINHWNIVHPRTEPDKTINKESVSLTQWSPAFCVDSANVRRVFPSTSDWSGTGFPENIVGERINGYDADLRNPGIQELPYSFWKDLYPYTDDQLTIVDAPKPSIGFRTGSVSSETLSSANYTHPYHGINRGITSYHIISGGNNYSSQTVILIDNSNGHDGELIPVISSGHIISVTIVNVGTYSVSPIITVYDPTGAGTGASITVSVSDVNLTIPVWWNGNPSDYRTGPIYHRPVYIGIQEKIYDCYPCIAVSSCTDYYDAGCSNFDGPTNPELVIWNGSSWIAGQYSSYNTQNLVYDEWTTHNLKTKQFTPNLSSVANPQDPLIDQITVQEFWNTESTRAEDLDNTGSTYCHTCDNTLYTGDILYTDDAIDNDIPTSWQSCGVYHDSITSNYSPFVGPYLVLNSINWVPTTTLLSLNEYDFPVGYNDGASTYELVHVYHRPSGYYYWEIRQNIAGVWTVILRSQLKEKQHTTSDIVYSTSDLIITSTTGTGYNGPNVDELFILDSHQNKYFTYNNTWTVTSITSFLSHTTWSISTVVGKNTILFQAHTVSLHIIPGTVFNAVSGGAVGTFTIDSNTPSHVSSDNFLNGNDTDCVGDYWTDVIVDPNTYIGKDTSEIPQTLIQGRLNNYATQALVCGNPVPYQETYQGIEAIYATETCHTSVTDNIEISIYDYTAEAGSSSSSGGNGDYIKIVGSVPGGYSTRQEHRFIPSEFVSMLPTDFNLNSISSLDYYLLKDYLPLYLFQDNPTNTTKLVWDRADSYYYSRAVSNNPPGYETFTIYRAGGLCVYSDGSHTLNMCPSSPILDHTIIDVPNSSAIFTLTYTYPAAPIGCTVTYVSLELVVKDSKNRVVAIATINSVDVPLSNIITITCPYAIKNIRFPGAGWCVENANIQLDI